VATEQALVGANLSDANQLRTAIALSFSDVRPLEQNAFKSELAQRAVIRALQTIGSRA
jgi:xanthine dehydrogenase YagS FAD-binding subunit